MDVISISNKTSAPLRVMLEPTADTFDIGPADTAEVEAEFSLGSQPVEIEFHSDNFVSVWVIGEVTVKMDGKEIVFPDL